MLLGKNTLAAVARGRQAQALQRGECQRMHFALRVAAGRPGTEAALAQLIEQAFGEDGTGRISRADEQCVIGGVGHGFSSCS